MKLLNSIAFCLILAAASSTTAIAKEPRNAAIEAVVLRAHAAGAFEGVALATDDDRIVYEGAVGVRDRSRNAPHRANEVWRWASVTKQITAILVMQEVERGKLALSDTLAQHLPAFGAPNAARITVRQLLQHTSGLPNPDDTPQDTAGVEAFYRSDAADFSYCAGPPKAEPGAGFAYNNCDYLLLGAILEKVEGKSYAALLRERIIRPLGLRSVALFDSRDRRGTVGGYGEDGAREPATINLSTFGAGGALYGRPRDLLAIDRAVMSGRLLTAPSREELWRGVPALGYEALGQWSFEARIPGCAAAVKLIERQGAIGGVRVLNLLAPDRKGAIILFSNTARTETGAIWTGEGLAFELVKAAWCSN